MKAQSIKEFKNEYAFLSNFYPAPIIYNGICFKNNEAAFQAQKSTDIGIQMKFASYNANTAKQRGKKIALRPDWEYIKIGIMNTLCYLKFLQNPDLRQMLLATGNLPLIEGNDWGDTFWGVNKKNGKGQNHLGHILMNVRFEFSHTSLVVFEFQE